MDRNILLGLISRGNFLPVSPDQKTLNKIFLSRGFWVSAMQSAPQESRADDLQSSDRNILEKQVNLNYQPESSAQMPLVSPTPAPEVVSAEEKLQKLLGDCQNMGSQVDQILEKITQMASGLTFKVPAEATEVRAALVALNMDPSQVSYQDYVELLRAQLTLAQGMSQEISNGVNF